MGEVVAVFGEPLDLIQKDVQRRRPEMSRQRIFNAFDQGMSEKLDLNIEEGRRNFIIGLQTTTDILAAGILIGRKEAYPEDEVRVHCAVSKSSFERLPRDARNLWDRADTRTFSSVKEMVDASTRVITFYKHPTHELIGLYAHKRKMLWQNYTPYEVFECGLASNLRFDEIMKSVGGDPAWKEATFMGMAREKNEDIARTDSIASHCDPRPSAIQEGVSLFMHAARATRTCYISPARRR